VVEGALGLIERLPVMPSNPEGGLVKEGSAGQRGTGGGWAYQGLVGSGGCWEGVAGWWEGSGRLVLTKST